MSNYKNAKDDILEMIFHQNHYVSKEEVLAALASFKQELKEHDDFSFQYLDALDELQKEIEGLYFAKIKKIEEEHNLDETKVSLPEDSYDTLLDEENHNNVYLYGNDDMPIEFYVEGRVVLEDRKYVILSSVEEEMEELLIVFLNEENRSVDYVFDEEIINKVYNLYKNNKE